MNPSAGTVRSWSDKRIGGGRWGKGGKSVMRLLQIAYTTHASAGTFTCVTDWEIRGWIHEVETDPGSPSPDDNYSITLKNDNGRDIMGGTLGSRDETNAEMVKPIVNSIWQKAWSQGLLTIAVTSAGNSRKAELLIYYEPV